MSHYLFILNGNLIWKWLQSSLYWLNNTCKKYFSNLMTLSQMNLASLMCLFLSRVWLGVRWAVCSYLCSLFPPLVYSFYIIYVVKLDLHSFICDVISGMTSIHPCMTGGRTWGIMRWTLNWTVFMDTGGTVHSGRWRRPTSWLQTYKCQLFEFSLVLINTEICEL